MPANADPSAEGAVSPEAFRAALGTFATGVTVVTTVLDGLDHAMTANAFTSVSLDPPLVLVCVEQEARFHDAIVESGVWGVSVLSHAARRSSIWFATRGRPLHGQLSRHPHHRGAATGVALLDASLATIECRTTATYDGGDHTIVVGTVVAVALPAPEASPLVWFRAGYHTLSEPDDAPGR